MSAFITRDGNIEPWGFGRDSDIWVPEAIWGHRLKEQPLHALLGEFLNMAEGMFRKNELFNKTEPKQDVKYAARKAKELRILLFQNPTLEQVADKYEGASEDAWKQWLKNIQQSAKASNPHDFSYLKSKFTTFQEFVTRVKLVRRSVMQPGNTKKWSHQLLYPMAPSALYVPTDDKFGRDRTLFARPGELAYLMLSRSHESLRNELAQLLPVNISPDTQKDNLILSLMPDSQQFDEELGGTYLPYRSHPSYDRLAHDLINILKLGLPENDVFEVMKYLIAFNLYLYALETSNHWCGTARAAPIVCEIMNTKSDVVRKYSGGCKRENEERSLDAVDIFLDRLIQSNKELTDLLENEKETEEVKLSMLREFLNSELSLKELPTGKTVGEFRKEVTSKAKAACRNNVIKAQASLGKAAGLCTKLGTNRIRYAPSDALLRALVLANVSDRMEESKLLNILYDRYHIIVTADHASRSLPADVVEASHFQKNHERFAKRLTALGLATRLSDACAYVENPYR